MIFADVREPKKIVEILRSLGIEVKRKMLDVADYLIVHSSYAIAVERKDARDYVNSIIDGRFFNQIYNLSKSYKLSFLFIIGCVDFTRLKKETFLGSILSIALKTGGNVIPIQVESDLDFCNSLKFLNNQVENGKIKAFPKLRKVKLEDSIAMLTAIPGIGVKKAEKLLKRFGNVYNIVNASISDLKRVEGIGEKQARRIYNFFRGRDIR